MAVKAAKSSQYFGQPFGGGLWRPEEDAKEGHDSLFAAYSSSISSCSSSPSRKVRKYRSSSNFHEVRDYLVGGAAPAARPSPSSFTSYYSRPSAFSGLFFKRRLALT